MEEKHYWTAKKLGITSGYWASIRSKKRIPSIKLAMKIEKMFPDKPEYKVTNLIPNVGKILRKAVK